MVDKLHELTALLLARMESHPDEFIRRMEPVQDRSMVSPYFAPRWEPALHTVFEHGGDNDKLAIRNKLGELQMNEAHRWAMDELLNGEERRADERRREEEERKQYMARQAMQNQAYQYSNMEQMHGLMGTLSDNYTGTPPSLKLGTETLDEGLLRAIKKRFGR